MEHEPTGFSADDFRAVVKPFGALLGTEYTVLPPAPANGDATIWLYLGRWFGFKGHFDRDGEAAQYDAWAKEVAARELATEPAVVTELDDMPPDVWNNVKPVVIACPACHSTATEPTGEADEVYCRTCGLKFPLEGGPPPPGDDE